jgi:pimeloyl-ACP methyl ester carboxylesterase
MSRRLWHVRWRVAVPGSAALCAVALTTTACVSAGAPGGTAGGTGADTRAARPTGAANVRLAAEGQPLDWGRCPDVAESARFECASMRVPLDYAKPDGERIAIALIRLPATDRARRIGSLVFNFGGPGGSGVSTLLDAASAFATLGKRYDLVSFDPRGVERSAGIRCLTGREMDEYVAEEPSEDVSTETRLATRFAGACQRHSGKILPYVGTLNAARDMEELRASLGDPWLNYFGFSYGTHLGAIYATLYPKLVGRMVLDSALDPSVGLLDVSRTQIGGFQRAFKNYLRACAAEPGGCPLGRDVEAANGAVVDLLVDLSHRPLTVNSRTVTDNVARAGIGEALYSKMTWPLLTEALRTAMAGDARGLLDLSDQYNGRNPNGTYSTLQSSLAAVVCADNAERPTIKQSVDLARDLSKESPIFSANAVSAGICSVWPAPGDDAARRVNATGSKPIVVVGVTHDPATPYKWAPRLADELHTAVLVTLEGEGHGAYGQSPCIDAAVNGYLLAGKVPAKGLRCR